MRRFIYAMYIMCCFELLAIESVKLKNTIRQGAGEIDLLVAHIADKSPTVGDLEWFRQDNSGHLVFAIDVNEAASGSEKAQSQAVTIKNAYVTVVTPSGTKQYSEFFTPTSTVVASDNDTQRTLHYTVIGDSGSSRITGSTDSDIYGSSFDGTLSISVPDDISNAISASLTVEFLQTNTSLGDPEAFYDFSGGYEDVAILSYKDKVYLEETAPGVSEAPLVVANSEVIVTPDAWFYYPSNGSFFVVSYEDSYPQRGDYDFNDLVVGYRVGFGIRDNQVISLTATGYMIARGASYTHDWYLHIPFSTSVSAIATINIYQPGSSVQISGYPKSTRLSNAAEMLVFKDSKSLMSIPGFEFANTLQDAPIIQGSKFTVVMHFDTPIPMASIPNAPYDPYLYTEVTGQEIHLPGNGTRLSFSANSGNVDTQYKDSQGYPYALVFPEDWLPPIEHVDLGDAYVKFLSYSRGDGSGDTSWYLSPNAEKTKNIGQAFWKW
ncbi:LruC domain-containing protein [Pseudoalteromonas sp. S16_S37]|uniref:LruC domain-containing protein n=1 Tax=Pseudoalteromonas sp. S16_S37 TaxID=2720228 RepID=UPI0016813F7C|nr:LruC domain-containing protein [Pseudoalteromonas sp. S16_S37]MBD1582140.1 LruC domain-containing protein [Pseudoalteromonas sp. S16_S37]